MTTKQATELENAITRATEAGVEVMGHGHLKGTNERVFLVPSQRDANHWHIVKLSGCRLICDCQAKVICVHRAAAHMELVVEAARKEASAAAIVRELEREAEERGERDLVEREAMAVAARRERAILVHSNAPFSIFK